MLLIVKALSVSQRETLHYVFKFLCDYNLKHTVICFSQQTSITKTNRKAND